MECAGGDVWVGGVLVGLCGWVECAGGGAERWLTLVTRFNPLLPHYRQLPFYLPTARLSGCDKVLVAGNLL